MITQEKGGVYGTLSDRFHDLPDHPITLVKWAVFH